MRACTAGVVIVACLIACFEAAAADGNGVHLNYVPQGCSLTVSVTAEESQPSWFQEAPEIRGAVKLSNPNTYGVPVNNIIIQARSSDGMQYSTTAFCDGGSSVVVPSNPQPYTYGTATCRYRLVLDRRVFGRYGSDGSRRHLLDSQPSGVQANFFPSSSGGGNSGGSGNVGYFPPPNQRPSWTVTAIATVKFSNAQCLSAPTYVNTDGWWRWLSGWFQRHHKNWFGGRKLLEAVSVTGVADVQTPSIQHVGHEGMMYKDADNTAIESSSSSIVATISIDNNGKHAARSLLSSGGLNNCHGFVRASGFVQQNADGTYSSIGTAVLQNNSPLPVSVSSVQVTVGNSIGYRPLFTTADCHGATVVTAYSSLTCNFAVMLPTDGASSNPSVWGSVAATASLGSSGDVKCTSAAGTITSGSTSGVGATKTSG